MLLPNHPSPLQRLPLPVAEAAGVRLYCKRDDLYTPAPGTALQGNKVRKLEFFLRGALQQTPSPILVSFGGAYSNHLAALATAGRLYGLRVVIFVRGEEVENAVLARARADGAHLLPLSRTEYRQKKEQRWLEQQREKIARMFSVSPREVRIIPEGGTSPASSPYVGRLYAEIIAELGTAPDHLCLSAGTGGSAAGVIQAAAATATRVEVFPALRGNWMRAEIRALLPEAARCNWTTVTDYHFGGYGKFPSAWVTASPGYANRADIGVAGLPPLDPVYTAKLFYGVLDRLRSGAYAPGSSVVVVHTGGIY